MSFLRHKEIYHPMEAPAFRPAPPLIVWMSFRLAIPWRVALQQSPPPLRQPLLSMRYSVSVRRTPERYLTRAAAQEAGVSRATWLTGRSPKPGSTSSK